MTHSISLSYDVIAIFFCTSLDNGNAITYFNGNAIIYFNGNAITYFNGNAITYFNGNAITYFNGNAITYFNGNAITYFNGNAITYLLDALFCGALPVRCDESAQQWWAVQLSRPAALPGATRTTGGKPSGEPATQSFVSQNSSNSFKKTRT